MLNWKKKKELLLFFPIKKKNSPTALLARKMSPAHVPHSGFPEEAYSLRGATSPHRSATSAIVVDSPPGMISPSQALSSSAVFTSVTLTFGRRLRAEQCSRNEPWRARTPTVTLGREEEEDGQAVVVVVGAFEFSVVMMFLLV